MILTGSTSPDYDVLVVGGGPGGSSLATMLIQAGVRTCLIESEIFPRQHVGESLVPAAMPVLQDIGVLPALSGAGFPRKYGACWTTSGLLPGSSHRGIRHSTLSFDERPYPGVDLDYTFHVDRAEFDHILLKHAESSGVTVRQGVRALTPSFSDDGVTVTVREGGPGGESWPITAHMLVDASGRDTFLGSKLKLKVPDPVFDQYAVYTWVEGFDRGAFTPTRAEADYIAIHFVPDRNTWIWQIPISDDVTSVGVVAQKSALRQHSGSQEDFFWQMVALRPDLEKELRDATVVDEYRTEGNYSYGMRDICGDRFVMVGDAARFVDPIFSSGISIALSSAAFAARDIIPAVTSGDFSKKAFERFDTTMRRGMSNWYEFISLYYRLNILFTVFSRDKRYRADLLKLLQGDLYDEDQPTALVAMRDIVTEVENNPNHLWHPYLGSLAVPSANPQMGRA